jgi:hypothetical protein
MARASNLPRCSFCGKSHAEVRKLIAGPSVYICDSCINVSKNILRKELSKDTRRQLTDIGRTVSHYVIGRYRACLEWFHEHVIDKAPFRRSAHTQHEEEQLPAGVSVTFGTRYKIEISLGLYQWVSCVKDVRARVGQRRHFLQCHA